MNNGIKQQGHSFSHRLRASNKGQMGIIFLVLALVGLMFFGIVVNWNKMAASRTQVTVASNMGASALVSHMGSYGQNIMKEVLDDKPKKCDWSGLLFAVSSLIVLSVFVLTGQVYGVVAILSVAIASAAVSLHGANVPPMMSTLWRALTPEDMLKEDRFIEEAIQASLPLAVSDAAIVADGYDFNMNNATDSDTISRLSFLYSERIRNMQAPSDNTDPRSCEPFKELKTELQSLADTLGLATIKCDSSSGVGDPCCVPQEQRAEDCPETPNCFTLVYGQRWPYDYGYCESKNNANSLLKFIGLDDNNLAMKLDSPNTVGSQQSANEEAKYIGKDSTGDIFPLLWKLHDSQVDISKLTFADAGDPGCHWCDTTIECDPKMLYQPDAVLAEQASLSGCTADNCCLGIVDSNEPLDSVLTIEPFLKEESDVILGESTATGCPKTAGGVAYDYTALSSCAGNIEGNRYALNEEKPLWRPGTAGWNVWPHYSDEGNINTGSSCWQEQESINNAESGSPDPQDHGSRFNCSSLASGDFFTNQCGCEDIASDQASWNTDDLDSMGINLRYMIKEIASVLDMTCATVSLETVYGLSVEWISHLRKMSCDLRSWRQIFKSWLEDPIHKEEAEAWCLPPTTPPDMSSDEQTAITSAAFGTLDGVLACLDWNANNQYRFTDCQANCNTAHLPWTGNYWWCGWNHRWGHNNPSACQQLPRSFAAHTSGDDTQTMGALFEQQGCIDGDGKKTHFWDLVDESIQGMERHQTRFTQRAKYLRRVKELLEEVMPKMEDMATKIDTAVGKLETKVSALCEQINIDGGPEKVYYVWSTKKVDNDTQAVTDQVWHAVKVEAAVPRRCDEECESPRFPWVQTYKKAYGLKRCWGLTDTDGKVKVTVTRYDDERDPISVIKGADNTPPESDLSGVCGSQDACISCTNCASFPGLLQNEYVVESAMVAKGHSVTTTGRYILSEPSSGEDHKYDVNIQQE